MEFPKDKKGREIHPGDIIRLTFYKQQRENPGKRRVAIDGMSGSEVIINDEWYLKPPTQHWIDYSVEWNGACLIATRINTSDPEATIPSKSTSIVTGKHVNASSATIYLNEVFNGSDFEVQDDEYTGLRINDGLNLTIEDIERLWRNIMNSSEMYCPLEFAVALANLTANIVSEQCAKVYANTQPDDVAL